MKKNKLIMNITIGVMCFLLTMSIFMQFKVVEETENANLDAMQETELRQELANWKNKSDEVREKYDEIAETLKKYNEESSTDNETKKNLEVELNNLEMILGRTDVEGEGVIITLSEKAEFELSENEEIFPISAEDLIYIVNYLKDAGAEAISINDERIVNTTHIVDVEKSIKINGRYLRTNTYIIKAIGYSQYLESSIFGKGGYVEELSITGIKAETQKSNKVVIPKYNGEFETKYVEEVK